MRSAARTALRPSQKPPPSSPSSQPSPPTVTAHRRSLIRIATTPVPATRARPSAGAPGAAAKAASMSLLTPIGSAAMPRRRSAAVSAARALRRPGSSGAVSAAPAKPPVTATTRARSRSGTASAMASARWSVSCGTGTVRALPGPADPWRERAAVHGGRQDGAGAGAAGVQAHHEIPIPRPITPDLDPGSNHCSLATMVVDTFAENKPRPRVGHRFPRRTPSALPPYPARPRPASE